MNKLLNRRSIFITIPVEKRLTTVLFKKKVFKKIKQPDFNNEIYKIVNKYKSYIEKYTNWDKMKCLTNPFEVITYSSYCKHQKPMTLYEPISRAYFKLYKFPVPSSPYNIFTLVFIFLFKNL